MAFGHNGICLNVIASKDYNLINPTLHTHTKNWIHNHKW